MLHRLHKYFHKSDFNGTDGLRTAENHALEIIKCIFIFIVMTCNNVGPLMLTKGMFTGLVCWFVFVLYDRITDNLYTWPKSLLLHYAQMIFLLNENHQSNML